MVEFGKTQIRLLVIILVGISISFLFHITPAEAASGISALPEENTQMGPFYWTVSIVGGCIAFTLTYVGWRKYKGEEKNKQKDKDANS